MKPATSLNRIIISTLLAPLSLLVPISGCASEDAGNDPGVLGSEASNIISQGTYPKFIAEIDYVEGYSPDGKALEFMKKVVREVINKPGGGEVILDTALTPISETHEYSLADIKAIEEENRQHYNVDDTVAVYFLFLDGRYTGDTDTLMTLGLAYSGSSMVMFKNNFAKVCAPLVAQYEENPKIAELLCPLSEGTTWVHEMGHLMGLVNTGTEMVTPHQDPNDHGAHCDNSECIMYWLNNTTDMLDIIVQRIETGNEEFFPFDANCLADLRVFCTPECDGKSCGDDGCGGSCGECNDLVCLDGACYDPGSPGSEAKDIVTSSPYTKFVVEVDYVEGYQPAQATAELISGVTLELLDKPEGGQVILDTILPVMGEDYEYTLDEIKALEKAHRENYENGDTAALYVLFLDGRYAGDTDVMLMPGLVVTGSSMVIFKNNFNTVCGPVAAALEEESPGMAELLCPLSEGTFVIHQMGHLMGLVNAGTAMANPHQDPDHLEHCDNPECIMHWKNDTMEVVDAVKARIEATDKDEIAGRLDVAVQTFFPFDANCLADLEAVATP